MGSMKGTSNSPVSGGAVIVSSAQNRYAKPANSPATGAPGIEGSPVVGRTLTATTAGISDEDGISTAVFAHQWLADNVPIVGATSSAYALVTDDEGEGDQGESFLH